MSDFESTLHTWYHACDPSQPVVDIGGVLPPTYVDLDSWFDSTTGSTVALRGATPPVARLERTIRFEETGGKFAALLFSGFRGAGKTTELSRLASRLRPTHAVLYVDASAYVGILSQSLTIVELSLTVLAAVWAAAEETFDVRPAGSEPIWQRIKTFLESIRVSGGTVDFGMFQLQMALRGNEGFRRKLNELFANRPELMREFVHAEFNRLAQHVGRPLVVLVDGLEKPNLSLEDIGSVYRHLAHLFAEHASWLRLPRAHVVYSVPPLLPVLAPGLTSAYSMTVQSLPSVKLASSPPDRTPNPPAMEAMAEVLRRRGVEFELLFGPDYRAPLEALVQRSGGHVRHLLEDARVVFLEATAGRRTLPLTAHDVNAILDAQHSRFNISTARLGRLLLRIHEGGSLTQLEDADIAALSWALDQYLVLAYANGQSWYDVHPRARLLLAAAEESERQTGGGRG